MSKKKKLVIIAAVLCATLLVFSTVILPVILKNSAVAAIQEATGRAVRIESASLNPFIPAVRFTGITIEEKGGAPFVSCAALRAVVSPLSIYRRALILGEVTIEAPTLTITRISADHYNATDIIERIRAMNTSALHGSQQFTIDSVSVINGTIHFSDAMPKGGFRTSLNDITITLKHVSTAADSSAEYSLSLLVDNEAAFTSSGSFSLSPAAVTSSNVLAGLKLERGWPYLAQFLTAPLKGILDLSGEFRFSRNAGLIVENGRMNIKNLSARYGTHEGLDASAVSLSGVTFTQKENRLEIGDALLSQGNISLSRNADGKLSAVSLLVTRPKLPAQKTIPAAAARKDSGGKVHDVTVPTGAHALSYRLKRLQVDNLLLKYRDNSRPEKPSFVLRNTSITLTDLNGPQCTPAPLEFTSTFGTQTMFKGSGRITPRPFRYTGDLSVGRLPIKEFNGYFPEELNVIVVNGYLDAAVKMDIALRNGKPVGTFKGSSGVRSFHSIDTIAGEDLLKWESLQLEEFKGSVEPFILNVGKIALNGVYSRIIIRKDGTLNLQNLMQQPTTAAAPENPVSLPSPPIPSSGMIADTSPPHRNAGVKRQITIGALTIQDGTISFSDNHLPQQFATTIHNLGGRISGLTSDASRFADVDLRGNLENQSPLQIAGKINPLRNDLFVDLKVSFNDIELAHASPYSGSYLGYTIEKGKLYLDLKYHIEKKILTSENRIFIDQFTFGSRVESDRATSLPVQLGLALIKDRNGEIHLDVPVTGRTDTPELSIWKLVLQAFKNVIIKALTSPLALLSSLFGSDEDFSSIQFSPGSSDIATGGLSKLDSLSRALLDRPALKIELKGYVDRDRDIEAYRTVLFKRMLNHEKFLVLSRQGRLLTGESEETVQVTPEEYVTYLAAVYNKEKFPKPRNIIGLVKQLPPAEMEKLITINTMVGEPELHALARERVGAVMNHLVQKGHVPAERIFRNDDDLFRKPEKESVSGSRVELLAIVQ